MLDLNILHDKYQKLQEVGDLNRDYLLRLLLDYILEVDDQKIDVNNSSFLILENGVEIKLVAKQKKHCTIYFEIFGDNNKNYFDIQLKEGGEYLHLQEISDWNDVKKLREALSDLVHSEIKETLIKKDDKIKKAIYRIHHNINDSITTQNYSITLGITFPWQRKSTEVNTYRPWIEKNI